MTAKNLIEILLDIIKANVWFDRTEYNVEDLAKAYPDLTSREIENLYSILHHDD